MSNSTIIGRRAFMSQMAAASLGAAVLGAESSPPKRILLRSAWATVNIGDIAHTPGMLRLLEAHIPDIEVVLWPGNVGDGVAQLLLERFPRLSIVRDDEDLASAFGSCDFLLHGSRASLGVGDINRWREATGKPYGIYAVTFPRRESTSPRDLSDEQLSAAVEAASAARFIYFRDSKSLEFARQSGVMSPIMAFAPDTAFACDLRDPDRAEAFLRKHQLEQDKFLCCIPRLRFTPYWRLRGTPADPLRQRRNEEMQEHDHAPLRKTIVEVVKHTDLKVLLCPEDQTQMAVGKELIFDRLPQDVRQRVVWRPDFWLTGEAISTYVRSAGLFGNEMHSPIMCIGHGVPAVVCRWAEQTTKGYMWEDIGLGDWLFDLDDESQVARLAPTVLEIATNPAAARRKAAAAQQFVIARQRETMAQVANQLP